MHLTEKLSEDYVKRSKKPFRNKIASSSPACLKLFTSTKRNKTQIISMNEFSWWWTEDPSGSLMMDFTVSFWQYLLNSNYCTKFLCKCTFDFHSNLQTFNKMWTFTSIYSLYVFVQICETKILKFNLKIGLCGRTEVSQCSAISVFVKHFELS